MMPPTSPTPTFTHGPIKGPWVLTWTNMVFMEGEESPEQTAGLYIQYIFNHLDRKYTVPYWLAHLFV